MFLKIIIGYLLIVIYLTMVAIGAEIYERKGYKKSTGAYLCLIPIYGIIKVLLAPALREVSKEALRKFYKPGEIMMKLLTFAQLTLVAILIILPVTYMIGSSFAKTSDLPETFLPKNFTLNNYKRLFLETDFWRWLVNTASIAVITMVISVVFVTGAGYVFARFKFKGKKVALLGILVLQIFPSFMSMIALFTLYEIFGLLGQPLALVIIYVGGSIPFNVWLIKGYLQQIPGILTKARCWTEPTNGRSLQKSFCRCRSRFFLSSRCRNSWRPGWITCFRACSWTSRARRKTGRSPSVSLT